jgi:hypothetical protein
MTLIQQVYFGGKRFCRDSDSATIEQKIVIGTFSLELSGICNASFCYWPDALGDNRRYLIDRLVACRPHSQGFVAPGTKQPHTKSIDRHIPDNVALSARDQSLGCNFD